MKNEQAFDLLANAVLENILKEKARWKAIGRKLREFHKGDIVFHSIYGFVEVVLVNNLGIVTVEGSLKDGNFYQEECKAAELELIVPAERRFDNEITKGKPCQMVVSN